MSTVLSPEIQVDGKIQQGKYLTFELDHNVFGIDISCVTEIVGMQKISVIPDSPDYVKGIINLRGIIIPVIDMRLKFHKNPAEYNDRTCIIVIEVKHNTVGLIVDLVNEVTAISDTSIEPPPRYRAELQKNYIKGIGKAGEDIRILLDCEYLLDDTEIPEHNKTYF